MRKWIAGLAALALSTSLFAANTYMIETIISKNKKVIDSPALISPVGQAGVAEAKKGKYSYELLVEVAGEKNGMATVYTNLTVNGKFHKQKAKIPLKEKVWLNMGDVRLNVRVIPYQ